MTPPAMTKMTKPLLAGILPPRIRVLPRILAFPKILVFPRIRVFPKVLAAALALALLAGLPGPGAYGGEPLSPEQVEAVESVIRDYIRDHPEIIAQAFRKIMAQKQVERGERQRMNIRALAAKLTRDPDSPAVGPDAASVTLVEFFDYACGYCKGVSRDLKALIDEGGDLRFVFKEFPILGEGSLFAARAALAARNQGKYVDFHFALMAVPASPTEKIVMKVAQSVGLDGDRLRVDMAAPEIDAAIKRNLELAKALGITGTPSFVLGETLIPGVIEITKLKELIAKEREG